MKYMGSKRWMLDNGLGDCIRRECNEAGRFVDLFAGSGAVSYFVAEKTNMVVRAHDLQEFSMVVTGAIVCRRVPVDAGKIWGAWISRARDVRDGVRAPTIGRATRDDVKRCREWSAGRDEWALTRAYGGHYFSPQQSIWIDALRRSIPSKDPERTVALAALISAASQCCASPGHTAQPFQATRRAKKYLKESWEKSIVDHTKVCLFQIAPRHARKEGMAFVADANDVASHLRRTDLVFVDPPYSGVHYSRFYHVLESIAAGNPGEVSGRGRYPDIGRRPSSRYSTPREAGLALAELMESIASKGARAIVTFPKHRCSNGLSGPLIQKAAADYFDVSTFSVTRKFSTMGGNGRTDKRGTERHARLKKRELVMTLSPRKPRPKQITKL